ncbi:glycerophosphodiester phosphodiesterase [Candidatus Woesearchaeota archaeon]|jgi:glycerophosphoryl diester phosphodiesterase|nr:glycerophosphodiester phosphodiesterase [Candidatus Woesearchaeota archaeon]
MLKIGHRGACGHEPENTLKSVRKAIDLGVDQIEIDVHVCKTGEVVVIHDETVDRTTNGSGRVSEMTFEELRALNIGDDAKIPTLEEVLFLVHNQAEVNIEIKTIDAIEKVLDILRIHKIKKVLISSTDAHVLMAVKKIKKALIFYSTQNDFKDRIILTSCYLFMPITKKIVLNLLEKTRTNVVNVYHSLATRGFIECMHQRGIKVNVWTVNDEKEIQKYKLRGVDGIISDYPGKL